MPLDEIAQTLFLHKAKLGRAALAGQRTQPSTTSRKGALLSIPDSPGTEWQLSLQLGVTDSSDLSLTFSPAKWE